mgnify:CR=1 FL=1
MVSVSQIFNYRKLRQKYKDKPTDKKRKMVYIPTPSMIKWKVAAEILELGFNSFVVSAVDQVADKVIEEAEGEDSE